MWNTNVTEYNPNLMLLWFSKSVKENKEDKGKGEEMADPIGGIGDDASRRATVGGPVNGNRMGTTAVAGAGDDGVTRARLTDNQKVIAPGGAVRANNNQLGG